MKTSNLAAIIKFNNLKHIQNINSILENIDTKLNDITFDNSIEDLSYISSILQEIILIFGGHIPTIKIYETTITNKNIKESKNSISFIQTPFIFDNSPLAINWGE